MDRNFIPGRDGSAIKRVAGSVGGGAYADMHLGVERLKTVSATFTRPANTTAYAALDVVNNSASAPAVLTFEDAARVEGGSGYVIAARLMTSKKADTSGYRLHLYHTTPTPINDNLPYLLLYADAAKRVATLDFPDAATEDATSSTAAEAYLDDIEVPFVCAADSRDLLGVLEILDALTPDNAGTYYLELVIRQN